MGYRATLIAAIPAIGLILDVVFYQNQRAIYDRFYLWWFHLSELNIRSVVQTAANAALVFDKRLCGAKIVNRRAVVVATIVTVATTMFASLYLFPHEPAPTKTRLLAAIFLSLFSLPAGLTAFFITRLEIRLLRFAKTTALAIALALTSMLAIEVMMLAFWFATGGLSAWTLKYQYIHGISASNAVSTFALITLFSHGYANGLLQVALFPTYLLVGFAALLLLIHFAGHICFFVQQFLSRQVERPKFAAFTAISLAVAALIAVGLLLADTVPARMLWAKTMATHEEATQGATLNGLKTTWALFQTEHQSDPKLQLYVRQVADGLDSLGDTISTGKEDYLKSIKETVPKAIKYFLHKIGVDSPPADKDHK
jgi:hypothetical protein